MKLDKIHNVLHKIKKEFKYRNDIKDINLSIINIDFDLGEIEEFYISFISVNYRFTFKFYHNLIYELIIYFEDVEMNNSFLIDNSFEDLERIFKHISKKRPMLQINKNNIKECYLRNVKFINKFDSYNKEFLQEIRFDWLVETKYDTFYNFLKVVIYTFNSNFRFTSKRKALYIEINYPSDFRWFAKFADKCLKLLKFPDYEFNIKKNYIKKITLKENWI